MRASWHGEVPNGVVYNHATIPFTWPVSSTPIRRGTPRTPGPWGPPLICTHADSSNDAFCVADTLSTVEQTTGTTVSVDTIMSLVSGDDGAEGSLDQAIGTGSLCTGCVAR